MNVKAPAKRGLQRRLNTLSDKMEVMNKEQMMNNQSAICEENTITGWVVKL